MADYEALKLTLEEERRRREIDRSLDRVTRELTEYVLREGDDLGNMSVDVHLFLDELLGIDDSSVSIGATVSMRDEVGRGDNLDIKDVNGFDIYIEEGPLTIETYEGEEHHHRDVVHEVEIAMDRREDGVFVPRGVEDVATKEAILALLGTAAANIHK